MDKNSTAYMMARFMSEKKTIKRVISDLFEYQDPTEFFDEYDLYELCKDKIHAKPKDKFKSIKTALHQLLEERVIVKRANKHGSPIYRLALYDALDLVSKGELEFRRWEEGEVERKVRESYNLIFSQDVPDRWADLEAFKALPDNVTSHYLRFSEVACRMVRELGAPETFVSWEKRLFNSHDERQKNAKVE